MFERVICVVLIGVASVAHAQSTTTGAIQGRVTDDKTGEPLAGITVIASSPALHDPQSDLTDETGAYKITSLLPGDYTVTFYADKLTVKHDQVHVSPDKVTAVFQKMAFYDATTIIEIHDPPPQIDPTSTKKEYVEDERYLKNIPQPGRTADAAAGAAAGAQNDGVGNAFSGSTSLENRYLVDGIDITGLTLGTVGTPVLNDFVEQIEVITGGYNAEYGRATGGIVNIVTKTGSNTLHGSVFGYLTPGILTAAAKTSPVNASSIDITADRAYSGDFGFDLGGPIVRDHLWFYVGLAPSMSRTDFTRTTKRETDCHKVLDSGAVSECSKMYADGQPDIDPKTGFNITDSLDSEVRSGTSRSYSFIGKLNLALSPREQGQLSLIAVPSSSNNPALLGAPDTGTKSSGLTTDAAFRWTSKLNSDRTELEALVAWHRSSLDSGALDPSLDSVPRQTLADGNLGVWSALGESAKTAAGCQDAGAKDPYALIINCPMQSIPYGIGGPGPLTHDREDRRVARFDVIQRGHLAGSHELKAGLDLEDDTKELARLFSGGELIDNDVGAGIVRVSRWVQLAAPGDSDPRFDQMCHTPDPDSATKKSKTFRCDYVSGVAGSAGTQVSGQTVNWAAYLRDSWQVQSNLTLNAGLRYEEQRLRYASELRGTTDPLTGEHIGDTAMNLRGNLAPRLGLIWDPTRQGQSKIFAAWGRFYESIPMDINDRSFGGEVSYQQTYQTKNMPCGAIDPRIGGDDGTKCQGAASVEQLIGGSGVLVAPGIKAEYLDEILLGAEYELMPEVKVGITYQNRRLGRVIEDVSTDGAQTYLIANPGEWSAADEQALDTRIAATTDLTEKRRLQSELALFKGIRIFDKPVRDYNALELTLSRRFSLGLFVQGSYTYSRSEGNYPGSISYDNGQLDPNISSQYDLIELLANRKGPLPQDRPHSIKLDAYYTFDLGKRSMLTFGTRARLISGIPENALGAHYLYGPNESFLLPRGELGRTDMEHAVDLHVSYGRRLSRTMAAEVFADIFNLYDRQATFNVDDTYAPATRRTTSGMGGTPNNVNPISGGTYQDLIWAKAIDLTGNETSTPTARNPNFHQTTVRYAPTSVQLGFRLTF